MADQHDIGRVTLARLPNDARSVRDAPVWASRERVQLHATDEHTAASVLERVAAPGLAQDLKCLPPAI